MPVAVLDEVQVLDQQVRPSRPVAEQRLHLSQRVAIELPALGGLRRLAASGTRMNLPLERARRSLWHGLVSDPGGLHSGPFDKGATRRSCAGLRRSGLAVRSEEHTSELQSLMRISYAVFCLKKNKTAMLN